MIICGSASLPREEEEKEDLNNNNSHERSFQSAESSPRKSCSTRRIKTHKNHHHHHYHHHKNNPYATRGLDKFVALLAEIEEKKQKIYSKNNPDEISLVQFDYSNGNKGKPIVIRVKDAKKTTKTTKADHPTAKIADVRDDHHDKSEAQDHIPAKAVSNNSKKKGLLRKLRKPTYYLSAVLILILIFLVLFGRSVAILCTSIIWYAIPAITNRNLNSTRSFKKKGELGTNSGNA